MEQMEPNIDSGELILGKSCRPLTEEQRKEWESLREYASKQFAHDGQDSHMAIDYDLLLQQGIKGISRSIDEKLNETDGERREELLELARICSRVPEHPAESFWEAVQSVHFVTYCLSMDPERYFASQQFQLGHPDKYLLSYYQKDLDAGKITSDQAQVLLDCLGIQINNRVPSGLSSGYMVGGRDRNGKLVANELTLLCMNVIADIRLVYPSVGLCYTKEMPDLYLKRACEILAKGCSHPAIFNEDIISQGLQIYGLPENESHDYIHSTCVEITPAASSGVWVASPYINLMEPLLDSMDREYDCMEDMWEESKRRLDRRIGRELAAQVEYRKAREERSMVPLLACFVNDCLERGKDIEQGGARYGWIMPSFVGLANLVDSLTVVETLVFGEKRYSIAEIRKMLECDFQGYEKERLEMLHKVPKYGNDDDRADKWSIAITDYIVAECRKYTDAYEDMNFVPSAFCWIMHTVLGEGTGATPDGRLAGCPLGDGSGAAQGRETKGPTASILSSTKWSHKEFIGGVAVNMKFSRNSFEKDSYATVMAMIKAYMMRGGFEIQVNVVDADMLLEARKNPEQYEDLLVRIGGYSDYFVRLSDKMQQEVILRTEHAL